MRNLIIILSFLLLAVSGAAYARPVLDNAFVEQVVQECMDKASESPFNDYSFSLEDMRQFKDLLVENMDDEELDQSKAMESWRRVLMAIIKDRLDELVYEKVASGRIVKHVHEGNLDFETVQIKQDNGKIITFLASYNDTVYPQGLDATLGKDRRVQVFLTYDPDEEMDVAVKMQLQDPPTGH